jgi:hypothetical protein
VKRHTASEAAVGIAFLFVMTVACVMDVFRNAQKEAWGWFWFSLGSTVIFASFFGWCSIDAFNRRQRRRREKTHP